ncbi:sensor histidine kinase [Desulfatiglans anilini]|uniref:sensor histidine kinase n=1 Tax=Desulfatiglans anilini TaxID=90728 RepID=UPI000402858E|nr:PAS domain-containing sensor histidine kinase [Desulfatiglans anilini]
MKTRLYTSLQKKIIAVTLFVSFAPLILLGATIYHQFARLYHDKIAEQMRYRANAQAEAVDLFLKERTAILAAMADTHHFQEMLEQKALANIFQVMNQRAGAFVDLGVIDNAGTHRTYIGPYNLEGLNYYQQPWFGEVMRKGIYISDVYLGYRQLPHFIIAVRRQEDQNSWILRATIDPDVFGGIVRAAQVGKTGDAFILNRDGLYQTQPRLKGKTLGQSGIDQAKFGGGTTLFEETDADGRKNLYAGRWLKKDQWLLVITQEVAEEMGGLFAARNVEILIILCGVLAIVLTTIFTTKMSIKRLQEADKRMNELNAQLVQSDKLAALGKMAAGVAHEINNPLAVILQKTGWMEDLLEEESFKDSANAEEFKNSIRKIEEHVERARKVVHNMLGYARRMEPRLEDVDVNETLRQTIALLENYARINNIEIATDFSPNLPIIANDQSQLQQVFLNLISNAIDAIGKEGHIEVKSRQLGSEIHVKVADNGPGMPEEIQKRVFDPFFTTKDTGKGTGLGLWVSYGIVEKLGGTIKLQSTVGKGSVFTVRLPVVLPEKK